MHFFVLLWLSALLGHAQSRLVGYLGTDEDAGVQLPLTRTEEGWYSTKLQLAGANVNLLVDTGSSTIWARTPKAAGSAAHKAPIGNFSAQYGRGAVSGEVIDSTVLLPGAVPAKPRACHLGRAIDEGGFWAGQRTIDGVLGLGCSAEGASADALACVVPTLPQRPLLLGPPQHRVFCLQMTPTGGTLTLGAVPREVQLNLVAMPAAENCGHWTVPLLSLGVQSSDTSADGQKLVKNAAAVLDSGSDGIIGPTFAIIELARHLGASPAKPGDGYGGEVTFYEVPCDATLPSVNLLLGEAHGATTSVTLHSSDLISAGKPGEDACHLRIAGWETQEWILGAVFLTRLQGVAFDIDTGVVAIAPPTAQAA